jgi:phosphoribosylamine-glycine ligase
LLAAAETIDADLTVVGPEGPLVAVSSMRSARRGRPSWAYSGSGATGREQSFAKNFLDGNETSPRPRS